MELYNYPADRYNCTKETVEEMLEKYGVAVIPGVLDELDCGVMVDGMWDFLENASSKFDVPIKRDDKNSWKSIKHLWPMHGMLIQHWGIGQAQMSWNLRQNPEIVDIFAHIWDTKPEDLLVSFDGASFGMPPEVTNLGWNRGNGWLHCDQSFKRNWFECVQSWVTGLDVRPGDATLTFLEGSHRHHEAFRQAHKVEVDTNWYRLSPDELAFYTGKGCVQRAITCPKGSLVLWDSRTIHAGLEPHKSRRQSNLRCVAYLCYMPREKTLKENVVEKRIKAFEDGRTTSHWPDRVTLFGKKPNTYGVTLPTITLPKPPVLTKLGRRLVGYKT
jgi:hypothetical protein